MYLQSSDLYGLLAGPWHWSFSGAMIAAVMFALLYAGKTFGFSSNLRTLCAIGGAGRRVKFFDYDWKAQRWNLVFAAGAVLGGFLAFYVIPSPEPVAISGATTAYLISVGVAPPAEAGSVYSFVPRELFAPANLFSPVVLIVLVVGGFLVGFGTRWAGGCTSGHAISGLSNLQLPSFIAVVGFFVGGLTMTWGILPYLLQL